MHRSEHNEVRTFFLALEGLFGGMDRLPDEIAGPKTFPGLFGGHAVRTKMHARCLGGEDEIHAVIDQTRDTEGMRQSVNRLHEPQKLSDSEVSFPNLYHHPLFRDDVSEDPEQSVFSGLMPVGDNV